MPPVSYTHLDVYKRQLIDMASVYTARGQSGQALNLYKQALQIERDAGDQNNEALCLNSIATINLANGDVESAFTYFQQALQLGEKIADPRRIADPLQGLGDCLLYTSRIDASRLSCNISPQTTFPPKILLIQKALQRRKRRQLRNPLQVRLKKSPNGFCQ